MRHLTTALLVAALAACSSGSTTAVDTNRQSGEVVTERGSFEVKMKIGETVSIGELRLTFQKVASDSRCPIDVVCVWAGDAEIALEIQQGTQAAVAALHTTLEPKKTVWNGYTISLVSVAPARRASEDIDPADYVANLLVTR